MKTKQRRETHANSIQRRSRISTNSVVTRLAAESPARSIMAQICAPCSFLRPDSPVNAGILKFESCSRNAKSPGMALSDSEVPAADVTARSMVRPNTVLWLVLSNSVFPVSIARKGINTQSGTNIFNSRKALSYPRCRLRGFEFGEASVSEESRLRSPGMAAVSNVANTAALALVCSLEINSQN